MDKVLGRLKWGMCLVHVDDILVFGRTFQEHHERLDAVFSALEKANLTLNVKKCCFATDQVVHLGHNINKKGIRPNGSKADALKVFPIRDVKSLRGFLGLASLYRRFVPSFASISSPFTRCCVRRALGCGGRNRRGRRRS